MECSFCDENDNGMFQILGTHSQTNPMRLSRHYQHNGIHLAFGSAVVSTSGPLKNGRFKKFPAILSQSRQPKSKR